MLYDEKALAEAVVELVKGWKTQAPASDEAAVDEVVDVLHKHDNKPAPGAMARIFPDTRKVATALAMAASKAAFDLNAEAVVKVMQTQNPRTVAPPIVEPTAIQPKAAESGGTAGQQAADPGMVAVMVKSILTPILKENAETMRALVEEAKAGARNSGGISGGYGGSQGGQESAGKQCDRPPKVTEVRSFSRVPEFKGTADKFQVGAQVRSEPR